MQCTSAMQIMSSIAETRSVRGPMDWESGFSGHNGARGFFLLFCFALSVKYLRSVERSELERNFYFLKLSC